MVGLTGERKGTPLTGEVFREAHRIRHVPIVGVVGWTIYALFLGSAGWGIWSGTAGSEWPLFVAFPLFPLAILFIPILRVRIDDNGVHFAEGLRFQKVPYRGIASFSFEKVTLAERIKALALRRKPARYDAFSKNVVSLRLRSGGVVRLPCRNKETVTRLLQYHAGSARD